MTVEKRVGRTGKVSWRVRIWSRDAIIDSATFRSKSAATEWERAQYHRLDRGRGLIDRDNGARTLKQWSEDWLLDYSPDAPATRVRVESLLRNHIVPHFGNRAVDSITRTDLRQWVIQLSKRRSPSTARLSLGVVRQIMTLAVEQEAIAVNPCIGVKVSGIRPGAPRALSHGQVASIAEELAAPRDKALFLLLVYTGLRWGEAAALRWDDITLDGQALYVHQAIRMSKVSAGRVELGDTKTHRVRLVALPELVRDALLVWWKQTSNSAESKSTDQIITAWQKHCSLIFPSRTGTPLRNRNWTTRALQPAATKVGIYKLTPHQLRDTYASLSIAAGASAAGVKGNLGHESISTTYRHYTMVMPEERTAVAAALDAAARAAKKKTRHTKSDPSQESTGSDQADSGEENEV